VIEGVQTKQLRLIADGRGYLMEILRDDDPLFAGFGRPVLCLRNLPRCRQGMARAREADGHLLLRAGERPRRPVGW